MHIRACNRKGINSEDMECNTDKTLFGFDIGAAFSQTQTFSEVSGINTIVIDAVGNTLFSYEPKPDRAVFCRCCPRGNSCLADANTAACNNVWLYGSRQAQRFGGKYIFFCPMGLVFFAAPLCINDNMEASYIGGPVMMTDTEQYLIDDIKDITDGEIFDMSKGNLADFIENLKSVPHRSPVQTRHLSELLFSSAAYICSGADYFAREQKKDKQQSDISAYIQGLKVKNDDTHAHPYPIKKEKELMDSITASDKKNAQRLLNEILGHIFFSSGGEMDIIRARVLELVVILSRAAVDGGADVQYIFGLNFRYLSEINTFQTIDDLSAWLSTLMNRFTESVFNWADIKHVDTIYKAIAYMRENYASKITLEDVSAYVYLSPSYFSKIFKDEMRTSFNSYLNKIRIDNAKRMLLNGDINIIDISNMVGYEDQSYFSKVFKKLTGVTPGKYRILRGKTGVSAPL